MKNVFHQEEFVWQSSASLVADHFLYSHNCNEWFRDNIIGRNYMLVTLRCHRATNGLSNSWLCCHISNVITHSLRQQLNMLYAELVSNGWTDDNIGCDILNRQWSKKKNKQKLANSCTDPPKDLLECVDSRNKRLELKHRRVCSWAHLFVLVI